VTKSLKIKSLKTHLSHSQLFNLSTNDRIYMRTVSS